MKETTITYIDHIFFLWKEDDVSKNINQKIYIFLLTHQLIIKNQEDILFNASFI